MTPQRLRGLNSQDHKLAAIHEVGHVVVAMPFLVTLEIIKHDAILMVSLTPSGTKKPAKESLWLGKSAAGYDMLLPLESAAVGFAGKVAELKFRYPRLTSGGAKRVLLRTKSQIQTYSATDAEAISRISPSQRVKAVQLSFDLLTKYWIPVLGMAHSVIRLNNSAPCRLECLEWTTARHWSGRQNLLRAPKTWFLDLKASFDSRRF